MLDDLEMMMTVSVCVWDVNKLVWNRFLDHIDQVYDEQLIYHDVCHTELVKWNAVTNWEDDDDPVHFESEEDLVQFLLAWS